MNRPVKPNEKDYLCKVELDDGQAVTITSPQYRVLKDKYYDDLEKYCNELEAKETPKKAVIKIRVLPKYGMNGEYCDADLVADYHCPNCDNWLSCDSAIGEEGLKMYCSNCGQNIEGVEDEETE